MLSIPNAPGLTIEEAHEVGALGADVAYICQMTEGVKLCCRLMSYSWV